MYDVSLHELWDRCNAIVLEWIMNTVSPSLISTIIYASNAYKVWEDLRERFEKVNASRACYLHKEIATLIQGVSSVSVYFSRLRELWDDYETLDPSPSCGCPESRQHAEYYRVQKLYQFLSGLHKSYENAKNQILMIRPLPNINQAYVMIVNVESQMKTGGGNTSGVGTEIGEHAALLSNRGASRGGYRPRNNYGNGKVPPYCEYFKFKGHTKDSCYTQHGYPVDFNCQDAGSSSTTQFSSPAQFFMPEQYSQILQMLNQGKEVEHVANTSKVGPAGITTSLMSNLVDNNWIVDTWATNHIVHNLELLSKFKELTGLEINKVHLPTGEQELFGGKVIGIGREDQSLYILKASSQGGLNLDSASKHSLPASYVNQLLKEHGVIHQSCCIYTPHQNGVVERRHRYILDMGQSLFEQLFSKAPSLQHLKIFGSLCYATNVKKTDKLCPRAIPVMHLGYSVTQKGYHLYDLSSKDFFVGRDTVFKEDIFSFRDMKSQITSLFPILELKMSDLVSSAISEETFPSSSSPASPGISLPPYSPGISPSSSPSSLLPSQPVVQPAVEDHRRSSRPSKPPVWMQDYVKYKSNGEVERYKVRLVAKGYSQQKGLDYNETFSSVAKMVTVRSVVALAAASHWYLFQMDVHNAFLQWDLSEEVFMQIPDGFSS
uniref:Retrovirus-related Pol polyprotein from transposon TNT 1-94 n=1 Tax=Nicotiana tabacum TaxID=4097 RepID=A0A1S4AHR9_TOBAC|nr:PREDICTED: uncharacterized protein LOC107797748 [Nicotiana tabacum]